MPIYAYTILHTAATVVVTYTNEQSNVVTDTNTLWYPVSPPLSGIESAWESRTTNLLLTNGVGTWEDAYVASNARVRFYAAAKRADGDVDGLTDGAEIFLYRTDPDLADTDGDGHGDGREIALATDPLNGSDYFGIVINAAMPIPPPPGSEVGREWVELFNSGLGNKSLAGFRLQTALPSGWTNVFTFPTNTTLDSGDFMVIGNDTNGDFQANLYLPNSSFTPPGVFGIRLVAPSSSVFVADALMYGLTNEYGFSLDGFGEELPILRPKTNMVIRRTWVGFDTDHAGDWKNAAAALWPPHTQGDYTDLDGDGLSNADEIASGVFPIGEGTRIDDTDTDADGVTDAEEAENGTNPNDVDTDGDAFPWSTSVPPRGNDGDEQSSGTDPLDYDSDNDDVPDGWELEGGLDPLSPDSDNDAMPDGDEDTDGDGIPNAEEVSNLTNPFLADDVDPRSYIWTKDGQDIGAGINEGDIGYKTRLTYEIKAKSDCPPIMVHVVEGGYTVEVFSVSCGASLIWLNPEEDPPTNRYYCIVPGGNTNFTFVIEDGGTTWPNETDPEYGADISLENGPTGIDLNAGEPEPSEESVGIVIADRISHPLALRRQLTVSGPDGCGEYLTHVTLTYDTERLQVYDSEEDGNPIASGTSFPVDTPLPDMYLEGISPSEGMRDSWVEIEGDEIPVFDRVVVTVLKANIGTVAPMADATLHPGASRQPLELPQTLPEDWNGIMALSVLGAQAYWTPTGGTPIVLGETVFTNLLLPQTVYLGDGACGEGDAKVSVIDLEGCWTNTPIPVFGVNATLAGVAELDEESPGGFIADRTTHTNSPRTLLTLDACGPTAATGTVSLSWNSSLVEMYTAPTGGTAMASLSTPFDGFSGTNLYVEGIAPGVCTLSWRYSEQSECEDNIQVTVVRMELTNIKFNHNIASSANDAINIRHDYTNEFNISNGEWVKGVTNIPACYTTNKTVIIEARFTVQPSSISSVDISALSTDAGGSLGNVNITNVMFNNGLSSPEYVTFQVSGTTPNCINKTTNDVWQWMLENINDHSSPAWEMETSGVHTVYTILNEPVSPWVNTAGDHVNAWKTALDIVCSPSPWAGGETSTTGAAHRITEAINGSGQFAYDIYDGEAKYLDGSIVRFSECISRLNGELGAGGLVNCTDCGNFITTFANLVGGELYSSIMGGYGFDTNPYTAIGQAPWSPPSWGWSFSYHEVGWTGNCADGDAIYDPCLMVDGNGDPCTDPRSEHLPVGIIFSDGSQAAPYVYRESLAAPGAAGYGMCVAQPSYKQRRMIK